MKHTERLLRDKQIVDIYKNGYSLKSLADMWGLTKEGIRKIILKNGVKTRPMGTNQYSKINS